MPDQQDLFRPPPPMLPEESAPAFVWHGTDADGHPLWMQFWCVTHPDKRCQIALRPSKKNAVGASWDWDGNYHAPTVTPSIDCRGACGWHGWIKQGRFENA